MAIRTSAQALQEFQNRSRSKIGADQFLRQAEGRLGVDKSRTRLQGLRSAIGNTEQLIAGVDPSVTGRTSGSSTTEAQRQRLVAQERAPLGEQLQTQQRVTSDEQLNLSDVSNRALKEAELAARQQDEQISYFKSLYDTLLQREEIERQRAEAERARRAAAAQQAAMLAAMQNQNRDTTPAAPSPPTANEINQSAAEYARRVAGSKGIDVGAILSSLQRNYNRTRDPLALAQIQQLKLAQAARGGYTNARAVPGGVSYDSGRPMTF